MNKNPAPDSTGGRESPESSDRALARAIVADAVDRYLVATRARIVPFVDDHFSFAGARAQQGRTQISSMETLASGAPASLRSPVRSTVPSACASAT